MKSRIGWKGMLVGLSVLIIFIGTFRYAIGDVSFPNTFSAGTPAVASQVNANFAAINARQTASDATLAGTYYVKDLQSWTIKSMQMDPLTPLAKRGNPYAGFPPVSAEEICDCSANSSFQGTIILTADGKVTGSGTRSYRFSCENCCAHIISISISGTYTVNAAGDGVMTLTETDSDKTIPDVPVVYSFQASKDLNTLMLNATNKHTIGTALRK